MSKRIEYRSSSAAQVLSRRSVLQVAMIGSRGVPANHGGFETVVEEVGARLAEAGHDVTVYCRNQAPHRSSFKGMRLHNLPAVRTQQLETLSHTALSCLYAAAIDRPDVALLCNAGNAPTIPLLLGAGIPFATHMDGLEWKRAKWTGAAETYYRWAEAFASRHSPALIADSRGIETYLRDKYDRDAVFIPHGAPDISPGQSRLDELDLSHDSYHLLVARFEPENHVREIVEGYSQSRAERPLVVVGDTPYSNAYNQSVYDAAAHDRRIRLIGRVSDQDVLDQLYFNCRTYLHGQSVGGTNPSLLRAMGAGAPVTAFDVVFNREASGGHAEFFERSTDLPAIIEKDDACGRPSRGKTGHDFVTSFYRWDDVATTYESLFTELVERRG
jgi:glycosyltransferase involved in cell wall biosynthesis